MKALSGILAGQHHSAAGIVAGVASSPYLYTLAGSLAVAMLLFQAALQACRASIVVPVSAMTGSVFFVIQAPGCSTSICPPVPASWACAWPGSRWPRWCWSRCPGRRRSRPRPGPAGEAVPGYLADSRRR